MINDINPRDLERLSASLDAVLSPRERARLDQRLSAEPALARALSELQRTRELLRRAPQRKVPRQFTLTAQMLGAANKAPMGGWSSLSLVSAVATLLLVVVFAGDFWANGSPSFGEPSFGAATSASEEAPQALMAEVPTESIEAGGDAAALPTETLDLYAQADDSSRQIKDEGEPFDLRGFMASYARPIELGLALVALGAASVVWLRRRRR